MRALVLSAVVCCVACGPLTPPSPDAGTDAGSTGGGAAMGGGATGGGSATGGGAAMGGGSATGGGAAMGGGATGGGAATGGGSAAWSEVALQVPTGTRGSVSRLIGAPGEVYALVSDQYVLRSAGARFNEVLVFSNPDLWDFQASWTGKGAAFSFNTLLACSSGCESGNSFEQFGAPSPRGLCTAADQLAFMSRASDGGTNVFAQDGGEWNRFGSAPLRSPLACTRSHQSIFFVTQGGVTVSFADGGSSLEVPDTTALGRQSSLEPWSLITTDGTQVFAASVRGAVAQRTSTGAWSVTSALNGEITALTTDPAGDLWVAGTGLGVARFTGGQWAASAGPALLVSLTSIAVESAHVYVGGTDAAGVARVFRRLR